METKKARVKRGSLLQRLKIQNEPRFLFGLQLVFSLLQLLLSVVIWGTNTFLATGYAIFLGFGLLLFLMAYFGWGSSGVRIAGRGFGLVVLAGVTAILAGYSFTAYYDNGTLVQVALTAKEKTAMFLANLLTYIQTLVLVMLPAWVVASYKQKKKTDIRFLHALSWVTVLMAIITLLVHYEPTFTAETTTLIKFSDFGVISSGTMQIFHLVCTIACALSAFALYPFGTKRLKRLHETWHNKATGANQK